MADYDSSLPIRSEADGTDERVHVKIVDGADPSKRAEVDSDKNVHVEIHGNDPAGVDRVVRTSEIGALTPDGMYDAANNTKPGNVGVIVHTRNATPGDAHQNLRQTGIKVGSVQAADVAIRDEDGVPYSATNPMPVTSVDSEGQEVNDYATEADVAADATSNHEYTVTALKTLKLSGIKASASGKLKIEVQIETAAASGIFNTKFVAFNSTSSPNIDLPIRENISVAAGVKVRIIRTNKDKQEQDLYSTIEGHEI